MDKIVEVYGPHLTIDGYECSRSLLSDMLHIHNYLNEAPDIIGMTKITTPMVFEYKSGVPEDWGVSGFILIAESHISIHTYPDKSFVLIDIFSCKPFDENEAVRHAKDCFAIGRVEPRLVNRGLEFPRNAEIVKDHLMRERQQ